MIGVIEPGARAGVAATRNRRIAVIATEGTVKGGAYARAIRRLMSDAEVVQQPCQVFVALAEEGWTDSPATLRRGRALSRAAVQRARRRRIRWCSAAPISRCWPSAIRGRDRPRRGAGRFGGDHGAGRGRGARSLQGSRAATEASAGGTVRFFATDSPERFARVGAIFLGRADRPRLGRARRPPRLSSSLRRRLVVGQRGGIVGRDRSARGRAAPWCRRRRSPPATGSLSQGRPSSSNTASA